MKVLVYGSLNIDHVYALPHFVRPGETVSSTRYEKHAGGKGLNQAIALAKAGLPVWFAGAIGRDGLFLKETLEKAGVNTSFLNVLKDVPTGHAVIQVEQSGGNAIILYGGANQANTRAQAAQTLANFGAGDYVLLQNEINGGEEIIRLAHERGVGVILNPSPMTDALRRWPLEQVDFLILNEVEGADLTGKTEPDEILRGLEERYPFCRVVLTLGEKGAVYAFRGERVHQAAFRAQAVDTTAAGDTFTGYFLRGVLSGGAVQDALRLAARASAITVSRPGAGESIPCFDEVTGSLDASR